MGKPDIYVELDNLAKRMKELESRSTAPEQIGPGTGPDTMQEVADPGAGSDERASATCGSCGLRHRIPWDGFVRCGCGATIYAGGEPNVIVPDQIDPGTWPIKHLAKRVVKAERERDGWKRASRQAAVSISDLCDRITKAEKERDALQKTCDQLRGESAGGPSSVVGRGFHKAAIATLESRLALRTQERNTYEKERDEARYTIGDMLAALGESRMSAASPDLSVQAAKRVAKERDKLEVAASTDTDMVVAMAVQRDEALEEVERLKEDSILAIHCIDCGHRFPPARLPKQCPQCGYRISTTQKVQEQETRIILLERLLRRALGRCGGFEAADIAKEAGLDTEEKTDE